MEVEAHEFNPRPFNSQLCNECDYRKQHPLHSLHRVLGVGTKPIWVDVPAEPEVICKHESWDCSGPYPSVKHSCTDCDWCWTNHNNPGFVYCEVCKPEIPVPTGTGYITKDSGKREEFDSGMKRDTQDDKPRFDLLLPLGIPYSDQFLTRVAELLTRGAAKYDERNWEKAEGEAELARFKASALRHLMQFLAGETDEDHAAAVVFNLMGAHLVEWKITHESS
jgi:hypothetical protein